MTPTCTYCGGQHSLSKCPWKNKLECSVEDYFIAAAKHHGALQRKVKWPGVEGAPDRVLMLPPVEEDAAGMYAKPGRAIWVEIKRPGGKAKFPSNAHERKQDREHERMRAAGQRVEIVDSHDGVDALFS